MMIPPGTWIGAEREDGEKGNEKAEGRSSFG